MTATEPKTVDLGELAVVAESYSPPDGALSVEVASIDELGPDISQPGFVLSAGASNVVVAPIGAASPETVGGLVAHLGAQLGVAPVDSPAGSLPAPVAATAVGVRAVDGTGAAIYVTSADPTPASSSAHDDSLTEDSGLISLGMLREVPLEVSAELGRTRLSVSEILQLNVGSVIELDRTAGAPVDVVVNGSLIARGEVVVIDGEYGIRITEILGRVSDSL